ncbi:hypothetical protein HU200_027262 [Digitaria exilis]|uniref:Disease resistance protein At4g27190-like leucine-rich repeats domain-containing protein n=1 Tax=Digitaria exilis TaxID=1010633 RepID=A0A835C747_9POAL|nr:hypothetical protein HU200_027262 [Digitaria exilis]
MLWLCEAKHPASQAVAPTSEEPCTFQRKQGECCTGAWPQPTATQLSCRTSSTSRIPAFIYTNSIDGAIKDIFTEIQRRRDRKVIYFDGWDGFGAAPVLRYMAQELRSIQAKETPPELYFDTTIYIDCSAWENRREMQRKIAEELKLDPETMAMFNKQDEEDDFSCVDHGSRDVIPGVSRVIAQTLVNKKFMMIFLNGSDEEIDVNGFGITPTYWDHVILWTFKRRTLTIHAHARPDEISSKLRYTQLFLSCLWSTPKIKGSSAFRELLCAEAANIVARHLWMRSIDLTMVTECFMCELFLQCSFHSATEFGWVDHALNYWTCDGIIKGDGARKIISDTLHQEIHWDGDASLLEEVFAELVEDPEAPFLVINEDSSFFKKRPYCRWICVTSKNLPTIQENTKEILERASSMFVALEKSDNLQSLPNGLLTQCSNLCVLNLYYCAFSFISPPFLQCQGLRFLGLDHCTHDNNDEGDNHTIWACLKSLQVLDLRYTEWDDILSEEKMNIMANLRELNIEAFMCWQLTSRLHGRLRYLQKLRIIKPTHHMVNTTLKDWHNSFVDKIDLEILDLSGNRDMKNLPGSLSMAKNLQMLILDGCDELENVAVPNGLPSSLRSFSFDGYGPATHWESSFKVPLEFTKPMQPPDADKRDAKTSKISLQGCTQLENLFVRGLPNLVELDLSGCAIKILDLTTMVVNVPALKRLLLLGCEKLRAILWGSSDSLKNLELLCIDTRPKRTFGFTEPSLAKHTQPSLAKHRHCRLQLNALLADARLARSLHPLVNNQSYDDVFFNIHITSSCEYGAVFQFDASGKEISEPENQRHHVPVSCYGDVSIEIGNAPMLVFPQPPTLSDHHIEISDGSHNSLDSELTSDPAGWIGLDGLVAFCTKSMHVHDVSTSVIMPSRWTSCRLNWCRVERCPNLDTVFSRTRDDHNQLEVIWASDLRIARCIWSKGFDRRPSFGNLLHLRLRSCPRLQFILPVWVASFPSLKTLHIIHCGDLTHVFVLDENYPEKILLHGVPFPKLTTIHLHDLSKLQQICEVKMLAPALETIKIRGCFGLRRLPALQGREPGMKRPTVEMEKDVWDALEWDGLPAGHHPDLFEPPVHSRYYRRSRLLRGTVLRYVLAYILRLLIAETSMSFSSATQSPLTILPLALPR